MQRLAALLIAALFMHACASSPPVATTPEWHPVDTRVTAQPDATGMLASCERSRADNPALARCRFRVGQQGYCGGPAPRPEDMVAHPQCICDGCATDADCAGGGTCTELPSTDSACTLPARVCVRSSEPCPGQGQTQNNQVRWRHNGEGVAVCEGDMPPRP